MIDRYLFRGKRIDNGEWVQGFYQEITKGAYHEKIENNCEIITFSKLDNGEIKLSELCPVEPLTVGQCTGMKDKDEKLIFEGDVVTTEKGRGIVMYDSREGLYAVNRDPLQYFVRDTATDSPKTSIKVVGDMFEFKAK